jgi:hypothetical protein
LRNKTFAVMMVFPSHRSTVMDDERFEAVYLMVMQLGLRRGKRVQYGDQLILLLLLWSALRRKPRSWVCHLRNAPGRLAGAPLPSPSQLSRRLRTAAFETLMQQFLAHLLSHQEQTPCLLGCFLVDAKALPVSCYSKDAQAKQGWACDRIAKGYKLFLLCDTAGRVLAHQVHAMNEAEPTVAAKLIEHTDKPGYLLGDGIYDSNPLHLAAAKRDVQLIAPRKDPDAGISRRAASAPRLHAIAMMETPCSSGFGPSMFNERTRIERVFSVMASATVGLDSLPPWVRTLDRVRRWVEAMIVFYLLFGHANCTT